MMLALAHQVGFMRKLGSVMGPKMNVSAVQPKTGRPSAFAFENTKQLTTFFVGSRAFQILAVNALWNISQIRKPVVRPVAVNVVNHVSRPFTCNVQPSKTVGQIRFAINADFYVPGAMTATSFQARANSSSRNAMRKFTSVRVVLKQFAHTLCGKIGFSHDALLMLIGQRPGGVASTVSASLF